MKSTILKIIFFSFLIGLWFFSLLELYNLSALYKDQVEMGEFVLSTQDTPTKASDYSDLKKTADEINILRIGFLVIFIGLPLIAIVKTLRNVYRTRLKKLDSKANK